jgi:cytochrome P450
VKEAFCLHPLAPILLPHENRKSCEIGDYHIFAKTCIFVNVFAIQRHPSTFENPLDFNPKRFVGSEIDVRGTYFQLLPFGSGKQMCPRLNYGLLFMQIKLARLLHSFTWTLPRRENSQDIDMGEVFDVTTPKEIPLQVVARARLPLHLYVPKTCYAFI